MLKKPIIEIIKYLVLTLTVVILNPTFLSGQTKITTAELLRKGIESEKEGRLATAERRFYQALILNSNNFAAASALAEVLLDQGKWAEALELSQAYANHKETLRQLAKELSTVRKFFGEIRKAVEYFQPELFGKTEVPSPYKANLLLDNILKQSSVKTLTNRLQARLKIWRGLASVELDDYRHAGTDLQASDLISDRAIAGKASSERYRISDLAEYESKRLSFRAPFTHWQASILNNPAGGGPIMAMLSQELSLYNNFSIDAPLGRAPLSHIQLQTNLLSRGSSWSINLYGAIGGGEYYDPDTEIYDAYFRYETIYGETETLGPDPYGSVSTKEIGLSFSFARGWMEIGYNLAKYKYSGYDKDGNSEHEFSITGRVLRAELKPNLVVYGTRENPQIAPYASLGLRYVHGFNPKAEAANGSAFAIESGVGFVFGIGLMIWF